MNKKLLISALFFTFLSPSYASTYFSYITDVSKPSSNKTQYNFVMQYWEMDRANEPNPCTLVLGKDGLKSCYISINHYHELPNKGGVNSRKDWKCGINLAGYKTLNEIRDVAMNSCGLSLPRSGYSVHDGSIKTEECIGFFLGKSNTGGSSYLLPGGICGIAPPPAGKCYFSYNGRTSVTLDHGTLSPDEINGDKKSDTFDLICNQSMSVKLISDMQKPYLNLRSNGEITSQVTLNGQAANSGIVLSIPANRPVSVKVESTLRTTGSVTPGRFNGRATLVMAVP